MSRLINADKLKKDILDLPDCYNGFSDTYDKACIIGVIDEQPTIERKKGKWIYTRPYSAINCSSCHHCSWSMPYEDLVKSFNYCPNCGARMEI